jgi:hypothetical protein
MPVGTGQLRRSEKRSAFRRMEEAFNANIRQKTLRFSALRELLAPGFVAAHEDVFGLQPGLPFLLWRTTPE